MGETRSGQRRENLPLVAQAAVDGALRTVGRGGPVEPVAAARRDALASRQQSNGQSDGSETTQRRIPARRIAFVSG